MEFVRYNYKEGKLRRRTAILYIHLLVPSWHSTEFLKNIWNNLRVKDLGILWFSAIILWRKERTAAARPRWKVATAGILSGIIKGESVAVQRIFLELMTWGELFNCTVFQFPIRWNMSNNSASLMGLTTWCFKFELCLTWWIMSTIMSNEKIEGRVGLDSTYWGNYFLVPHDCIVFWHLLGIVTPLSHGYPSDTG